MLLIISVVLSAFSVTLAQDRLGKGEIRGYSRIDYGGGAQNWAMAQDRNNRLYVANNEGLLVFDGTNWQVYPVPNKTILRSIGFGPGGKLYAGAQDELGYFAPDEAGRLRFTSLKDQLPAGDRTFTDVWELQVAGSDIFFRTNAKLFRLNNGRFDVYPAPANWHSLHLHQGRVLAQDDERGLLVFENAGWQPFLPKEALPPGFFVTDITHYNKDTSLLSTTARGLYLLVQNKLLPFSFRNSGFNTFQYITSVAVIGDTDLLIGTYFNGIYHLTKQGRVRENISTGNGLPNNTVRFVFNDHYGNAWAGLDNGLGFYSYNHPVRHINPPAFNNGAGYSAATQDGELYFALSTGLQSLPIAGAANLSAISDQPKTILGGLTWNIFNLNNQLLAGRDDGLWKINNGQALLISGATGYWVAKTIPGTLPPEIAAGNYTGIEKFAVTNGSYSPLGRIENFSESSRYMETDEKNLWISHPYRGIYKIDAVTNAVYLFTHKDGLPADLDNHVFKIKGRIVFATSAGIYTWDQQSNKMAPAKEYESLFGKLPIRYLKEDEKGNIWFVREKMVGVADFSGDKPMIHYIPELKNKVLSGFENIFPYNTGNILIGSETGFYHIDYDKYLESIRPFTAYISQVTTGRNDSILFGGFVFDSLDGHKTMTIPHKLNSLHFAYASSLFSRHSNLEFSYYLEDFDKGWSTWSSHSEKEYTNLPAGTYTFHVKARNGPSHESSESQYTFTIKPPWYETIWAYALYLLLITALLAAILNYQALQHRKKLDIKRLADQKKFEEEQRQTVYRHQLELEKSENELIRLQNEKLEAEILHKNAELASATMNLVQKKEFILKLKAELQQLQKTAKVGDDNPELKKVLKALGEEEKLDDEWEQFSQHFNSVYGDFLTLLKNKYPALKPHELRLCAYLRMNLSSKEIAPLMSISIRGVEISRYRLRKKLTLPTEMNLVQFLMDFH